MRFRSSKNIQIPWKKEKPLQRACPPPPIYLSPKLSHRQVYSLYKNKTTPITKNLH